MVIGAPSDENQCRQMLQSAWLHDGPRPCVIPAAKVCGVAVDSELSTIEIGKANVVREGSGVAILNFGVLLDQALAAGEALDATVVDMRWVKPLDEAVILSLAAQHQCLITFEENAIAGGAGSGVAEFLTREGVNAPSGISASRRFHCSRRSGRVPTVGQADRRRHYCGRRRRWRDGFGTTKPAGCITPGLCEKLA